MKIEKPITDKMNEKCKKLFYYLKGRRDYATKEEIGEYLGINNERSVRDVIGTLAEKYPVIATSDNRGYKLAVTLDDLDDILHEWKELDHRQAKIEARKKPLIAFYEKAKKIMDETIIMPIKENKGEER